MYLGSLGFPVEEPAGAEPDIWDGCQGLQFEGQQVLSSDIWDHL